MPVSLDDRDLSQSRHSKSLVEEDLNDSKAALNEENANTGRKTKITKTEPKSTTEGLDLTKTGREVIPSNDSPEESLKNVIVQKRSKCSRNHLIFGTCLKNYPSITTRALIVCGVLILEIALTGASYWSQYGVRESYEGEFTMEDLSPLRECAIGAVCAFAGLAISSVITIIHAKKAAGGIALSIVFIVLSSVIIIYMAAVFNKVWSMTWMFSYLVCAIIEVTVGQAVLMCIAAAIFKPIKKN